MGESNWLIGKMKLLCLVLFLVRQVAEIEERKEEEEREESEGGAANRGFKFGHKS